MRAKLAGPLQKTAFLRLQTGMLSLQRREQKGREKERKDVGNAKPETTPVQSSYQKTETELETFETQSMP